MTETMLVILALWFASLFFGVPIFLSMALAAAAFLAIHDVALVILPQKIAMAANSFPLLAAPLFILMGSIMNAAGITQRVFAFATVCVGWMKGGLCQANIVASVIFAGMSGSAVADAAGLGTVEIKAMKDAGYDAETAGAITAASATIGPIIPPSLPMIIYGVTAEASIGALFIAGIVPGLLMAVALMLMVRAIAVRKKLPAHPFPSVSDLALAAYRAFWALMAPLLLIGGMLWGVFTPTECAAVAALYALVLGLFVYREFSLGALPRLLLQTVETTGVVMALVMTASLFSYCLSIARIPHDAGDFLRGFSADPLVFLLLVNLLLLLVGCFMEAIAAMLILIPILVPVALALGIDPVQFGVVVVLNLMIGTLTPPVGIVLFVTARVAEVPFDRMCRAVAPFLIPLIAVLILITVWPPLTTWLPKQFG